MAAAFVLHIAAIAARDTAAGRLPVTSMHEAASFFAWCIALVFFILVFRYKLRVFVSFIVPIVFLVMLTAAFMPRAAAPNGPSLLSPWPWTHALCAFAGIAAFAVAAAAGAMFLIQRYALKTKRLVRLSRTLPSLQVIDAINHRLTNLGFVFFSIGILAGALWAEALDEGGWQRDPMVLSAFATWLIYGLCLLLRRFSGWRQRRAAILSIVGFGAALFTFFGVTLLLQSFHAFK
jgi:cytochrome c-type biogenesis protein CcsB